MFAPSSAPLYQITLLRHGESTGNASGVHQGQADFPLSPLGEAQVQALVRRWKQERQKFDLILSSPLQRARQTAERIAEGLQVKVEYEPCWMERDVGQLQGLSTPEAEQSFPRPAFIHPYQAIGSSGESQWQLYTRAAQGVQSLIDRPPGRYLVISHGGLLNMLVYAMLGLTPQANFSGPRFQFANTGFASLNYQPGEHRWSMASLNDQQHLKGVARTP